MVLVDGPSTPLDLANAQELQHRLPEMNVALAVATYGRVLAASGAVGARL